MQFTEKEREINVYAHTCPNNFALYVHIMYSCLRMEIL